VSKGKKKKRRKRRINRKPLASAPFLPRNQKKNLTPTFRTYGTIKG
jgi:hypothetical protein